MLKEILDPVDKNVEAWMLELEAMMRLSVKEVMRMAIEDYLVTPRPKWMQKWPSMCVLNGSQMHWTSEMETLFLNEGINGPKIMYANQVAQLADMTVLVRGELSKAARNVVGALTVIDVNKIYFIILYVHIYYIYIFLLRFFILFFLFVIFYAVESMGK
jgi:dynein heavy chain